MIVESMNDSEFALEVIRDYVDEMLGYSERALQKKGRIKRRHTSTYTSKRRNEWFLIYRPYEYAGQIGLYIKRPQPKKWFTWYSIVFIENRISLVGFNKHVAERISKRYHPELTPSDALKKVLIRTPAIIQNELGDSLYTRVDGGICLGPANGKRIRIDIGRGNLDVDICETRTFVSDDLLYDDQKEVTQASIARAIKKLGDSYLSDLDRGECGS